MKNLLLFAILITGSFAFAQQKTAELIKKTDGFSHPESVVYDEDRELVYISNIGEKDPGDGFISKTNLEGEVLELNWITGLNDPKGLLVWDDLLYVSDNTYLVIMDIETGSINKRIEVEGSAFLNDITADDEGNIYISDSGNSSIYILKKDADKVSQWLSTEKLEFPNGLLVVDDYIYVAAWGKEDGGNLLKVALESKEITKISEKPIGNLDGIQLNNNNNFYISDWATGEVHEIDRKGKTHKILTSEKSSGDILFHADSGKMVLPMNRQNSVWWYQIND
ncbi:SMP-30/gluconolactonase/LRE family protein [Salegentibacter sediminis]|uniref:SMP-30/gluconolactonase/LRE family protein n=1 Tax=Salegentibacter sediminis TaxID=1930251 RepID=UPI0012FF5CF6|nr:SMP-30/gluconolactonase/LRE family protein [Salegentibacter sediminis]